MSGRKTTLHTENDFPKGEFWLQQAEQAYSESNAKHKRIALEQYDEFLTEKGLTLEQTDNTILEEFSYWLASEKGHAHSTLQHRFYAVRKYLNKYGLDRDEDVGYIERENEYILDWLDFGNETTKQQGEDIHWLPMEKIEQLIDGAKNLKNRMAILLLVNTGCRPSEVARMKIRKMDRDERRIKVKSSKITDPREPLYERNVFYPRSMRSEMREWLDYGGRDSYPHSDSSPYLIVGYNTPSISARQINKIVRMAAEEAGIQEDAIKTANTDGDGDAVVTNRVTPKVLRHSFCVHAVRGRERTDSDPMDIRRLAMIAGHRSLETTKQYLRFRKQDLKNSYDRSHPW